MTDNCNGAAEFSVPEDDPLSDVIDVDADAVFEIPPDDEFYRPAEDNMFYKVA